MMNDHTFDRQPLTANATVCDLPQAPSKPSPVKPTTTTSISSTTEPSSSTPSKLPPNSSSSGGGGGGLQGRNKLTPSDQTEVPHSHGGGGCGALSPGSRVAYGQADEIEEVGRAPLPDPHP